MPLTVRCPDPNCSHTSQIPAEAAGRKLRCAGCGTVFLAPTVDVLSATASGAGGSAASATVRAAPPAETIGRFVVRRRLGAGAFGTVYRAYDPQLEREVALKVPNAGALDSPSRTARFLREAKAAANLRHPHIVPVFDAGQDGDRYFIASAFVEGRALADTIDDGGVPFRRAARLVAELADALAYAHAQGVVHRDVKPANILVDAQDGVHLMDFGIAARAEDTGESKLTNDGAVLGTPSYMAPEQAAGQQGEAKPAADQYAAGVVLYELLTGEPPFAGPPAIVLYNAVHTEPEPPSKRRPRVPKDLETICRKAMAKRPGDRYPDCGALARDLRRWLEGRPVSARPLRTAERLWRWCRREPRLAAAQGVAVGLLAALLVGLGVYADEQSSNARTQKALREGADRATADANAAKGRADREAADAVASKARADAEKGAAERRRYLAEMVLAARALGDERFDLLAGLLDRQQPGPDGEDRRGFEWFYLRRQGDARCRHLSLHSASVQAVGFDPAGERVISCGLRGDIRVSDARTGAAVAEASGNGTETPRAAISPAGDSVAACGRDGRVRVWDARTNSSRPCQDAGGLVSGVAFDPAGRRLAGAGRNGKVVFWDAATGAVTGTIPAHAGPAVGVAFSPDGRRVACVGADKVIAVLDPSGGGPPVRIDCRRESRLWDVVAFSPDGRRLAAGVGFRDAGVWDAVTGREVRRLAGHSSHVYGVAFSPDGRQLATASTDRTVRVWDVEDGETTLLLYGHGHSIPCVAFSPDGRRLASGAADHQAIVWDLTPPAPEQTLARHGKLAAAVATSPTGELVASCGTDGRVRVWDLRTGRVVFEAAGSRRVGGPGVAISPDGRVLAGVGPGETIKLWDIRSGRELGAAAGHGRRAVTGLAFSPDGRLVASGGADNRIRLWDVATAREVRAFGGHGTTVFALAFSPDGTRLASGGDDRHARVWDVASGRPVFTCDNRNWCMGIAFHPDGRHLVSAGLGDVNVWDGRTGKKVLTARDSWKPVQQIAFTRDGRRLASRSENDKVSVWDTETWQLLLSLENKAGCGVAFTPDGRRLVAGGPEGRVVVWDGGAADPLPEGPERRDAAVAWHRAAGDASADRGDLFAVAFHAGQLAILTPGDAETQVRAAESWVRAGQPLRAAPHYLLALAADLGRILAGTAAGPPATPRGS